jgi:HEAT repeat protein
MYSPKLTLILALVLALGASGDLRRLRADSKPSNPDEELLREAKVGTDSPGLLAFFRERTPGEEDLLHPERLVRQLASPSFDKREEASRTLIRLERIALPLVRRALSDDDAEVAKRAKACVAEIKRRLILSVPLAAVRLLRERHPDGAVEALLRYLPFARDEETEEELWYAVEALTAGGGKVHPALLAALKDPIPARRALAACLVARRGDEDQRAAARKLLADGEPLVRLRTAQGFLAARDKQAIPALVALLEEPDVAVSWQAEELLHYVAGDDAPAQVVGAGTATSRKKCRAAWEMWWKKAGEQVDLRTLEKTLRRPSLVLVCGYTPEGEDWGRVCLFGCNGPARWQLRGKWDPVDVQLLPANRLLVGEKDRERIVERNLEGEPLKEQKVPQRGGDAAVQSCRRLATGDTFIFNGHDWLVVDDGGKMVLPVPDEDRDSIDNRLSDAVWLGNECVLCIEPHSDRPLMERAVESDQPVQRLGLKGISIGGKAELLPSGNWLVESKRDADEPRDAPTEAWYDANCLTELTPAGKIVWQSEQISWSLFHSRRNGNILLGSGVLPLVRLYEQTRSGQTVWEALIDFTPARMRPCLNLVSFGLDRPRSKGVEVDSAALRTRLRAFILALDDPEDKGAIKAREVVRRLGLAALPALVEALKSDRTNIQIQSALLIGECGPRGQPAVEALRRLMKEGNMAVRGRATATLGAIGPGAEAAIPELIEALHDSDKEVRWWAAHALGQIGPAARVAVPALLEALKGEDHLLRCGAAHALGNIKVADKKVIDALLERLTEKDRLNTRLGAAGALGKFGLAAKAAVPQLMELLQSKKIGDASDPQEIDHLQSVAAWALGRMGVEAREAAPLLVKLLQRDIKTYPMTTSAAAEALGNLGPSVKEIARPALADLLRRASKAMDSQLQEKVKAAMSKLPKDQ